MSERKLWFMIICYVFLIFLTIPLAPFVVDEIRKVFGKSYSLFVSGVIIISLFYIFFIVRFFELNTRGKFWMLFLLFTGLSIVLLMEIPAERIHFIEYGFLGFILSKAFQRERMRYFLAFSGGAIVGFSDELIQGVLQVQNIFPHLRRYFEWKDVGMNFFGVFLGIIFSLYVMEKGRKTVSLS